MGIEQPLFSGFNTPKTLHPVASQSQFHTEYSESSKFDSYALRSGRNSGKTRLVEIRSVARGKFGMENVASGCRTSPCSLIPPGAGLLDLPPSGMSRVSLLWMYFILNRCRRRCEGSAGRSSFGRSVLGRSPDSPCCVATPNTV